MSLRYLALDDHPAVAGEVTGQQVETLLNAARTELADSALQRRRPVSVARTPAGRSIPTRQSTRPRTPSWPSPQLPGTRNRPRTGSGPDFAGKWPERHGDWNVLCVGQIPQAFGGRSRDRP